MPLITLNKNNFFYNLDIIAKKAISKDKIAIVLKDNAYGHGLLEMAKMSQEYGLKKAVVQNIKEAKEIEEFFEYILVLADVGKKSKKIRYTINDIDSIKNYEKGSLVELKVDTGMHRNGIVMSELEEAFKKIKDYGLILEAVFTHHSCADELNSRWFWQNNNFKYIKLSSNKLAKKYGFNKPRFHSANSASLFRTQNFDEDMLRVGLSAYGYIESEFLTADLKPVLNLWANKISSRVLKKGEEIGYGAIFRASDDITVSNYDFGYGNGFLRILSNNYETPNGEKLLGRISMGNSTFISTKEKLLIFNDAKVMSSLASTIVYEILTSLKDNIKRDVLD